MQDKTEVLSDVCKIISDQLGTELAEVRYSAAADVTADNSALTLGYAEPLSSLPQVKPDSKFVDLGADSLDTVSECWPC